LISSARYKRVRSCDDSSDSDPQTRERSSKSGRRDSQEGGSSQRVIFVESEGEEEDARARRPFSIIGEGYFGDFGDRVNDTAKPLAMTKEVLQLCLCLCVSVGLCV
jgi:hypothetical protein